MYYESYWRASKILTDDYRHGKNEQIWVKHLYSVFLTFCLDVTSDVSKV